MGPATKRQTTKAGAGSKSGDSTDVLSQHQEPELSFFVALTTYVGYAVLILFGHIRDFCGKNFGGSRYLKRNRDTKGYATVLQDWENFYTRRLYHRIQDGWNRPIAGPPFANGMHVVQRVTHDNSATLEVVEPLTTKKCVNLGSYNYLGFADDWEQTCKPEVLATLKKNPISPCTSFAEGGYTALHQQLEEEVASFLGKEAAVVFNMGFATNFLGIPAIVGGKGCLIISNNLNHNSIVNGARSTGATIRVFKHRNYAGLESLLRQAIVEGQDRTHRPWRKIVVMVEGIYSMEGDIENVPAIVALCKKYKAYLYLDEAHSIGAMGRTGRGVCEHTGVSTADVDVMMGTFTKSFGAMGGYIAGSKELIDQIRQESAGFLMDNAMSPVVAQQILTTFNVIQGKDGTNRGREKLDALRRNSNYVRERLQAMGAQILGSPDSPIIPLMLYNPTKISAFTRECFARDVAVVVVGFPATPLVASRARFCVSAGHTIEDLDRALTRIDEVCGVLKLRYSRSFFG